MSRYKVKENLDVSTENFWYDITDGGYIKPEEILEDPADAEEVKKALSIVEKFEFSCNEQIVGFQQ